MATRTHLLVVLLLGTGRLAVTLTATATGSPQGDYHVNNSATELATHDVVEGTLVAMELCAAFHLAASGNTVSDPSILTSLAECYARGHIRGVPLSPDLAISACEHAAQLRKSQRPRRNVVSKIASLTLSQTRAPSCTRNRISQTPGSSRNRTLVDRGRNRTLIDRALERIGATFSDEPLDPVRIASSAASLSLMAQSPSYREAIISSGVLRLLAESLSALVADVDVVRSVSAALLEIVESDLSEAMGLAIVNAGFAEPLVDGLATHMNQTNVTGNILCTLVLVGALHLSAGRAYAAAGATPVIASILMFYSNDNVADNWKTVQLLGATLAITLQSDSVDICTAVSASRAFQPVLSGLSMHAAGQRSQPGFSDALIRALFRVATHAVIDEQALADLVSCAEPLKRALRLHALVPSVVEAVCAVFASLAARDGGEDAMVRSDVASVLVFTLERYMDQPPDSGGHSEKLLQTLCQALANIASGLGGIGAASVQTAGAVPALVELLWSYLGSDTVTVAACGVMKNLSRYRVFRESLVEAGSVPAIIAALKSGVDNAGLVEIASLALEDLSSIPQGKAEALNGGVVSALADAVFWHGTTSVAGKAAVHASVKFLVPL